MAYAIAIGLIMLLATVIVALNYRGKAKAEQYHAALQKQRADRAEAINNNRQQLESALETLQQTHREEIVHDNNPQHLAARRDFDNDWAATPGLHSTESAAAHTDRATAADSAGAAGDQIDRAGLSER